ncbi:MAG: bi-domain-containing oxidoreductase [Deltaproteobacteria bacterium]|nr:bi-domain-containing oxidoreductase [Deltaproteobacteria bacterium]
MKQIVRRVIDRKGKVVVIELPAPQIGENQVLVENRYSLISTGTEMSTLTKTPVEMVKQTLSDPWMRHVVQQTVFSTGLSQTFSRVWLEMIMPREIGYSGAGRVLAVGDEIEGIKVGDYVAHAATGHGEVVAPTANHVVPLTQEVDLRHAAFVTVGGIVIQSLRRADVKFGEVVAVYGLGLLGQLCVMIARAAGCRVVGLDINDARLKLASQVGAELTLNAAKDDVNRRIMDFTGKHGVDATIICASSKSDEIINKSMEITRRQGRVVLVGYVGLDIHPKNFLYKEIDLRYSRAYGPGSYHMGYAKGRLDYPFGYVRWTEQRNLAEFIRLVADKAINVEPLIGRTYKVAEAQKAFDALQNNSLGGVAALIDYETNEPTDLSQTINIVPRKKVAGKVGISIVGVGNHALSKHLPKLKSLKDVQLRNLISSTGKNAYMIAKAYEANCTSTSIETATDDPDTDGVLVLSNQPSHFSHAKAFVEAGKAVYLEKPSVMTLEQFNELNSLIAANNALITLGLNRRYSRFMDEMLSRIKGRVYTINYYVTVPFIPPDHWTLDEVEGGGRLVTEGEHFIDLCNLIVKQDAKSVAAQALGTPPDDIRKICNFSINIKYESATANIFFVESGAAGYPRERVSVLFEGGIAELDDFALLSVFAKKKEVIGNGKRADMGHSTAVGEFIKAIKGEENKMLTWAESAKATKTMFAAQEALTANCEVVFD